MPSKSQQSAKEKQQRIAPQFVETANYTSGYHDKLQQDELPEGAATLGSQNFILDTDGKWTTRKGSKYLGTKSAETGGITSSGKILRRDGVELPVVFYATKSKYFNPDKLDWVTLETGLTNNLVWGVCMGEKSTDNINYLVMCNGTDGYRYWSGITGLVSSVTANTIVLQGSVTLANLGFTASGSLSLSGVVYTYSGVSGQTFTGVAPDPSAAGVVSGDPVTQLPVTTIAGGVTPLGSVLVSYGGRIVMFTKPSTALYGGGSLIGGKLNNYNDFSFSSPRVASEGYQLMMNEGGGNGLALLHFEDGIACFKQNAVSLHKVTYDQNDYPTMQPFLPYDETLSGHIGIVGQKAGCVLRNQVFFVSPRKIINSLQRVSQVDYPQALPFSDRIQNTVDNMTWDSTTCCIGFNYTPIFCGKSASTDAVPDKQLVYDQRFDCWWTPLIGQSISSYFVYGGNLYGTLATSPDVIQLNVGTTDFATSTTNGNPINATLVLGRKNYKRKATRKRERRRYMEGWMSKAGSATFTIAFDENGGTISGTLSGNEDGYFFDLNTGGTFGEEEIGVETFGGIWDASSDLPDGVGHFRILFTFPPKSYWNTQMAITTSSYFKLLDDASDPTISPLAVPPTLKKDMS